MTEQPAVMMPREVVAVLRLTESTRKDGTVKQRALGDALRSLDYLHRTGALRRLPGRERRYSTAAVMRYANGEGPDDATRETVSPPG